MNPWWLLGIPIVFSAGAVFGCWWQRTMDDFRKISDEWASSQGDDVRPPD